MPLTGDASSLGGTVAWALHKDVSGRYESVGDLLADLRTAPASQAAATVTEPEMQSIAVLPFADLSPGKDQEYFCDGLAEELIDTLARLDGLRVVGRTSSFQFRDKGHDLRAIGEQLKAKTVLEGSVRKAGNRLRINGQLINTDDGYHVWSERYDRTMDDVFVVQEEIAQKIVEELKVELVSDADASLVKVSTTNLEAYNLLLKGRHYMFKLSPTCLHRAIECFERAVAIEPDYAPAYAGLAWVLGGQGHLGLAAPHDSMPKARDAANRALAADPTCAEAVAELADVRAWYDWDFAGAEREYRRALDLGPASAEVYGQYGLFLARRGRLDEAIAVAGRGLDSDLLSAIGSFFLAMILFLAERSDEAVAQCRKTLDLEPHYFPARRTHALVLSSLGRHEEAVSALEAGRADADGDPGHRHEAEPPGRVEDSA